MQKIKTSILNLSYIDTPIGPMLTGANESHLLFLQFIDEKFKEMYIDKATKLIKPSRVVLGDSPLIIALRLELQRYFQGTLKNFKTPIDVIGTSFQKSSWSALRQIPYGDTWSYSKQAKFMGSNGAHRAVGSANGRNNLMIIIPCHRVVRKDRALGGFAAGIERKQWLLNHENYYK